MALPLNRDETQPPVQRKEHTYFSYGQIVYRGRAGAAARPLAPRPAQRHALERLRPGGRARDGARHPPARAGGRPALPGHRHLVHAVRDRPAERHPHPLAQAPGRDPQDRHASSCGPIWAGWSTSPPSACTGMWAGSTSFRCTPASWCASTSPRKCRARRSDDLGTRARRRTRASSR